jgi:drug/metabolite transporter (DMT)-like permease
LPVSRLSTLRYPTVALLAAALFGLSAPVCKRLLDPVSPLTLAGLLYLGSGVGLLAIHLLRMLLNVRSATGPSGRFPARDAAMFAGAVICGGVAAPVMLLWGLVGESASTASLLLSMEGILTTLLAGLLFHEAVGARVWAAVVVMAAAGALLAHDRTAPWSLSIHALAIAGACFLWGLDNNLTRNISGRDPVVIAGVKGLVAGSVNISLGWLADGKAIPADLWAPAMLLGLLSYGVSLVLYILALRHLGSARTAAYFGTAPFIGVSVSILWLHDTMTAPLAAALILVAAATWLLFTERHEHQHLHEVLDHSHLHSHDAHHLHTHAGGEGPEPHTHWHRHEPMTHSHPHTPDLHHRHQHPER